MHGCPRIGRDCLCCKLSGTANIATHRRDNNGLSWFKPAARDHLDKAFAVAALLTRHGIVIEIQKAARVGYVLYEDGHQIEAEAFADL